MSKCPACGETEPADGMCIRTAACWDLPAPFDVHTYELTRKDDAADQMFLHTKSFLSAPEIALNGHQWDAVLIHSRQGRQPNV